MSCSRTKIATGMRVRHAAPQWVPTQGSAMHSVSVLELFYWLNKVCLARWCRRPVRFAC